MHKCRKKPVVIEAMQNLLGHAETISSWMKAHGCKHHWDGATFTIPTLEGEMRANRGDWIIKGVKGEFYPCKPDIFEATYDPVI
jgi:hypothetical protein